MSKSGKEIKKAIAFGIFEKRGENKEEIKKSLEELRALARTADYKIEAEFIQKGEKDRKFLIRRGKIKEVTDFIKNNDIEIAICNNILKSSQVLALEEELRVPVIDRLDLILNIFELHANSREAKLQIELARLRKKLPFIKTYLGRKIKPEHPGFGSSGEYIIRASLTTIRRRIKKIEKELEEFERRNEMQREKRKNRGKIISLAGYTNVGKSSLAGAMANREVVAKNELFTTLRTKTLSYKYNGELFLVSDTIGFVRNLPPMLIAAFKATLGDIVNSDLILLIHDAGDEIEEIKRKKKICEEIIMDVFLRYNSGISPKILNVFNKVDLVSGKKRKEIARLFARNSFCESQAMAAIFTSAKEKYGIEQLKHEIYNAIA